MANPVIVEMLRGNVVESVHRGAGIVVDADGATVIRFGDPEAPVFPRSAVKAIQALPLVESGAADAFGFGEKELALASASHSGEPAHVALAASMLERAGLGEDALECGTHRPRDREAAAALARSGEAPSQLHNNCSGKHAGFLCACVHQGIGHRGYSQAGHPCQDLVREAMIDVTGAAHDAEFRARDGCSIPTYAVPLSALALGFARMATGRGLAPGRAKAAKRILGACMAEPFHAAGTDRADTALMRAAPGRIMVKTGAEGVYCGAVPGLGCGIALKCDDGGTRASEVMVTKLLAMLFSDEEALAARLNALANPVLTNWNGFETGMLRTPADIA